VVGFADLRCDNPAHGVVDGQAEDAQKFPSLPSGFRPEIGRASKLMPKSLESEVRRRSPAKVAR
jgi:hypothetical protein